MVNFLFSSWEFRTEDHDIKFGIMRKTKEGGKTEIIPIHRVSAHQMDEIGVVTCEGSSTCNYYLLHISLL